MILTFLHVKIKKMILILLHLDYVGNLPFQVTYIMRSTGPKIDYLCIFLVRVISKILN